MSKLKFFLQQSWLLLASSFFFGLLIAMTNAALSDRIELNKAAKLNDLTKVLLPGAEVFQPVEADIQVERPDGSREKARIFEVFYRRPAAPRLEFQRPRLGFRRSGRIGDRRRQGLPEDHGF